MRGCFLLLCLLGWSAACAQPAAAKDDLPAKLRYDRPAGSAAEQRTREEAIFRFYSVPLTDLQDFVHVGPRLKGNARMFRTRLRQTAATAPVFADTVSVQRVGCGTECFSHAMVDVRTGASYVSESVSGFAGQRSNFRRNSRVMHVVGFLNEEAPGDRWYVWTGDSLKLVYFKPLSASCFAYVESDEKRIAQTAACDYLPEETPEP